jgi:isocitrate/isopropylmalate dehydrogenase
MMFEYTLDKPELSKIIKKAVDEVLNDGYFTKDLSSEDFISTSQMGDMVLERIKKQC